ncbi:MAG: TRAP transporter permease [Thermodesulfobacteriota bacterium]
MLKDTTKYWTIRNLATFVAVIMALFHVATGLFGSLATMNQNSVHLIFILVLVFLIYPLKRGTTKTKIPFYDWIAILLSILSLGYLPLNYQYVAFERIYYITPLLTVEKIFGILLIILLLEATRRTVGYFLMIVPVVLIAYTFLGPCLPDPLACPPTTLDLFLDLQYLTSAGIFGVPLSMSASYLVLLIIFGALVLETGFGDFIGDLSMGIFGAHRGGPAKVAVVSSALFGTVSGSGSANVAVTGNFTIPLMKRTGFAPHFAGAVEAAASTGGQIMPPIMGAAAFIMAQFLAIPYITIMKNSIIPAILYFASIFIMVDFEAARVGIQGLKKEELPQWKSGVFRYWHMLLPIFILLGLMFVGRTIVLAVTISVLSVLLVGSCRKGTRINFSQIARGLLQAARGTVIVAIACAVAGLMIGAIYTTGLGEQFVHFVIELSGSNLILALIAAMITAIVLGMGMPTSAAYILMAALVIPALIKIGLEPLSAHMFAFYFACLSLVTPPVAPAAYVAAGIADSHMTRTAWTAVKLVLVSFIVPFMFVYSPALLFIGSWWDILEAFITAMIGVYFMAATVEGYWHSRLNVVQRLLGAAAALLLIKPGWITDLIGLALVAVLYIWEWSVLHRRVSKAEVDFDQG